MKKEKRKLRVEELLIFLQTGKRRRIAVEDYIRLTSRKIKWNEKRKKELYSALARSNAVSLTYRIKKEERKVWNAEYHYYRQITVVKKWTIVTIIN